MNIEQRLTASAKKRVQDKERKAARSHQFLQRLHQEQGVLAIYPPKFNPANMIDESLFRGDQKGQIQSVQLREYDFASDNNFDEDIITFYRKRSTQDDSHYEVLGEPIPVVNSKFNFPISVDMPAESMQDEGTFDFRFHVEPYSGGAAFSPPARVTLDWTPPNGLVMPGLPIFPIAAGQLIDSTFLNNLPDGKLIVKIPPYTYRESTDKIIWAWLSRVPDAGDISAETPVPLPDSLEVEVPVSVIQAAGEGDGRCYFAYILFDRALNVSHMSYGTVNVSLRPAPGPVLRPEVPLAEGGLGYADIAAGIEILIPPLVQFEFADRIYAKWGDYALISKEIGLAPDFPIAIPVALEALRSEYPETATGPIKTVVSYEVRRGVNAWPSPELEIDVDFSTIGPPNPGWPDPINVDLPELTVTSFTRDENEIVGEANFGQDATVTFRLFDGAKSGQLIQLYWNGKPAGEAYAVTGTEPPADPLSFPVPWAVILAAGDGLELPVNYTIRAADSLNEVSSKVQDVRVLVVPIVLEAPSFPQTVPPKNFISCLVVHDDGGRVHVKVPAGEYVKEGTQVMVHWRGYLRAVTGPEVPPHKGDPVESSNQDVALTWRTGEDIAYISPSRERVFPLHPAIDGFGFCEIYYTVEVNGQTIRSESFETRVATGNADGPCAIPDRT